MSAEKNNTKGQPEEPDLTDLGPKNVIPVDFVRMQMRRKLHIVKVPEKSAPVVSNLEYLAEANLDVSKAMAFCNIMGIDIGPLKEQLADEVTCHSFYCLLNDYLSAIQLCVLAGMDLGKNALLFHSNQALARAAMNYTINFCQDKRAANVMQIINKMKVWLSQKIDEEL